MDNFLTIRIDGDRNHPHRLLLIAAPVDGSVRVREWTSENWNTEGADVTYPASTLLSQIESAFDSRRGVSEEIYKVRQWLGGNPAI